MGFSGFKNVPSLLAVPWQSLASFFVRKGDMPCEVNERRGHLNKDGQGAYIPEKTRCMDGLKIMDALEIMAGGIAHDLNNMLSGIVSIPDAILADVARTMRWAARSR